MVDRCIYCGEIIPEGRQVCQKCESNTNSVKGDKMTLDEARMKYLFLRQRRGGKNEQKGYNKIP